MTIQISRRHRFARRYPFIEQYSADLGKNALRKIESVGSKIRSIQAKQANDSIIEENDEVLHITKTDPRFVIYSKKQNLGFKKTSINVVNSKGSNLVDSLKTKNICGEQHNEEEEDTTHGFMTIPKFTISSESQCLGSQKTTTKVVDSEPMPWVQKMKVEDISLVHNDEDPQSIDQEEHESIIRTNIDIQNTCFVIAKQTNNVPTRSPTSYEPLGIHRPFADSSSVHDLAATQPSSTSDHLRSTSVLQTKDVTARPVRKKLSHRGRVSAVRDFPCGLGKGRSLDISRPTSEFAASSRNATLFDVNASEHEFDVETCSVDKTHSTLVETETKEKDKLEGRLPIKRRKVAQSGDISSKISGNDALIHYVDEKILTIDRWNGSTDITIARRKMMQKVNMIREIYDELLPKEHRGTVRGMRIDMLAFKLYREHCPWSDDDRKYVGHVPGVEVGDEFKLRIELGIIGLHRLLQAGIDYINHDGRSIAVSVVSSWRNADDVAKTDELWYAGSGAADRDQVLDRGNLALKNSMDTRTPVRVIRAFKERRYKEKSVVRYVYDGLYLVDKVWRQNGKGGHRIFMFRLRRLGKQRSRMLVAYPVLHAKDISQGKEDMPMPVTNSLNQELPKSFKYMPKMIYPYRCILTQPRSCSCLGVCSDLNTCACAVKNGGRIPFNDCGEIIKVKPLIYECGPSCGCPPTCRNRVSQHGIKVRLEVFKTESRGWGVRSPDFIPSGTFICEYVGELLSDEVAEKMTTDEYFFDIGIKREDSNRRSSFREVDEERFVIDAFSYGNVGRFINHSCSPNLYAQDLFYDHENINLPHIMFFATENIAPFEELTYDYNYGMVYDTKGAVKEQTCRCDSMECVGRLY